MIPASPEKADILLSLDTLHLRRLKSDILLSIGTLPATV